MALPIEFHPEAAGEGAAARAGYGERRGRAGAACLAELDSACQRIAAAPGRYPAYDASTRRYVMRRFPFNVIYRMRSGAEDSVEIIAVAHGRRRTAYWRNRFG